APDPSADLARPAAVPTCRAPPLLPASDGHPVDVRAVCDALAAWNGKGDPGSRGAVLWRQFFNTIARANPWRVPFDPPHPLTTPRAFNTSLPAVRHVLADVVHFFHASHIPLDERLGTAQRHPPTPVPRCTATHRCFNLHHPPSPGPAQSQRPPPRRQGRVHLHQGHRAPPGRPPPPDHPHLLRIAHPRLTPLHRPDQAVLPQAVGHRTVHPSPDHQRPPA